MNVYIIGNGITGVSAALKIQKIQPSWNITIISGESNYHYCRPALMYIFMGHMRYKDTKPYEDYFWKLNNINLMRDWIKEVDFVNKILTFQNNRSVRYDILLIATGSKSNKFGWPGQDLNGVQGFYDLMDLNLFYENTKNTKNAVIVSGDLIGIELAEMLHTRNIHVTFLVRENSYLDNVLPKEESVMINRVINSEHMDLLLETELKEIVDDGKGRVSAVITNKNEKADCEFVGLTAGVSPNIDLVRDTDLLTGRGILVEWSLKTQIEDVIQRVIVLR
ncbi:MAG: FAD-dependent oxidoreductase [Thermodesulfobacteriota bacterium]